MLPVRFAATRNVLRASQSRLATPMTRYARFSTEAKPGAKEIEFEEFESENPVYLSPWNKWFPYEPVPASPKMGPYIVKCVGQTDYWFDTSGASQNQPWDDGSWKAQGLGFKPMHYFPRYSGTKFMCGCKKAPSMPLCNGTCVTLWADYSMVQAVPLFFGASFVFGLISTWWFHP
eukprot:gnl/TRDRNA2_/TRDRNA2_172750_c0_seq1.p1 gnl/TRDRNA2_/TRDRNA2_172750_c0~~gnl/TRDRNA2_/TRDRNA2_172750_c0_seq1.p1  ORF type:complete len:175 (+),score=15.71 gnl/TRDRNA2_/TRDRNA2_172750_c0_seq1:138-662(+)